MTILERINSGESIKDFNIDELEQLAVEIRKFLIEKVSENGGHLASNLGIVELTIALYYVFDFPEDKVVWDVGHQSYVHKILSGRMKEFDSLRKLGGLSGFPKTSESEYDSFNTGHASTSISAALGMAKARDLKGDKNNIIAVIGDGSLGGGMAYEAINDAGNSNTKMLVILNDNHMSISENVGAMSRYLNSIRISGKYVHFKQKVLTYLEKNDHKKLINILRRSKNSLKRALMSNTVFESLGLTYFGPFDGHDIKWLVKMLYRAKKVDKCVLFHVKTVKGKGYAPAEKQPQMYHGVSKFNYRLRKIDNNKRDYSTVFGEELIKIAEKNKRVVAVTAAMPSGTGLIEFAEKFPKRFFDVGIAEQHAVTTAAGMAINGLIPVVPIYSTFMQRGFDSILHDVCFQNLHVVLCGDRAGIVGEDGETHQGVFDLSFMRMMPNMTILAPADFNQLKAMLKYAVNRHNSPIFIRYPRGGEDADVSKSARNFECGKAEIIKEGKDVCIIAAGRMTAKSIKTAEILESRGISTKVIDVRTVKPLDRETILNALKGISLAVTVEDNIIDGGMGEELLRIINDSKEKTDFLIKAYECGQIEHGKADELMKLCKMDSESIADEITARIRR